MKELYLTPRDHDLLYDIYNLTFVDVEYISQVIYKEAGRPTISKRLNLLERDRYIKKFRLPLQNPNPSGRSKNVYTLDEQGVKEVRELVGEHINWDHRKTERTPLGIYHTLQMAMIKATYQEAENENLVFKDWLNEQRAFHQFTENKNDVVRPDGLMVLNIPNRGVNIPYVFELERSRQRIEVTKRKLKRYNNYCKGLYFKKLETMEVAVEAPPRILFVSKNGNESRALYLHADGVDTSATSGVLFTTYEQLLENPYGKIFRAKGSTDPEQLYTLVGKVE